MPAGRSQPPETGAKSQPQGPKRPPWVKEGPPPIPMPSAPWTLNKRGSVSKESEAPATDALPPRKTSSVKITPSLPKENGAPIPPAPKPAPKEQKLQSREIKVPVTVTSTRRDSKDLPTKLHIDTSKKPVTNKPSENVETVERKKDNFLPKVELRPVSKLKEEKQENNEEDKRRDSWLAEVDLKPVVPKQREKKEAKLPKVELKRVPTKEIDIDKEIPSKRNAIVRQESLKKVGPPPPPMPPPPPPPQVPFPTREQLSRSQLEKLDNLRSRPRKRPDWGAMMKDIETGKKLKHVQCNDRSQPLLPENKAKGQFIYESEQGNLHNELLKQIQTGAALKHVKTNDRSKPILEGLRKFRRQMTIEEQIQKSQSMANMPEAEVEEEVDEMDDIDKVRDDLQSTKQMLALELRNKEAQVRENKRLLNRLQSLEAELELLRAEKPTQNNTQEPVKAAPGVDEKVVISLKEEVVSVKKIAEEMEKKYHETADQLDLAKNEIDEAKRQNRELEKKLQQALQGNLQKRQSFSDRRESLAKQPPPPEEEEEDFESESEESEGEDTEEKKTRRAEREVRMLRNKLKSLKNKQEASKKERKTLKEQVKKNQQCMKEEKKKYKSLQKEVNKMAALMKDEDEDEEDAEEESEEEVTEEESESESESSESEEESSESEDEDLTLDEQKSELQNRVKRHENCLNALKKGNYMLKANVDRLQDDLNKQKEEVQTLQEDLDSVLSELG